MKHTWWIVGEVVAEMSLSTGLTIKMTWAKGMAGVSPVFKTEAAAKRYAIAAEKEDGVHRELQPVNSVEGK